MPKKETRAQHAKLNRLVTNAEVRELTNRSKSTIHDWVQKGKFPEPIRTPAGVTIGYRHEDVEAWLNGTWEADK